MTSKSVGFRPSRAHSFCVAGAGPMPMMRGATPAVRAAEDAGDRREAVFCCCRFRGNDQRGGAVIDAGGIAGGNRAALAERRRQLGQRLDCGAGARMLVLVEQRLGRPCAAGSSPA